MTEQRKKKSGVRKVLGASVSSVVVLLSKIFQSWSSSPFWLWCLSRGMQWINGWNDFAYKAEISPLVYIGAGLSILLVGLRFHGLSVDKSSDSKPKRYFAERINFAAAITLSLAHFILL